MKDRNMSISYAENVAIFAHWADQAICRELSDADSDVIGTPIQSVIIQRAAKRCRGPENLVRIRFYVINPPGNPITEPPDGDDGLMRDDGWPSDSE